MFDTELVPGDVLEHPDDSSETLVVLSIASATSLTLKRTPSVDLSADTVNVRTFTEVPQITGLSGGERVVDEIDTSSWSDGLDKTFLSGRADPGEYSGDIVYDPGNAQHVALETDQTAGTVRSWRAFIYTTGRSGDPPDASNHKLVFDGYIKSLSASLPGDGSLGGTFTIRASGVKSWVPAT